MWIGQCHSESTSMDQDDNTLFWLNLALLCVCGGGIIPNVLSAVVLTKERNCIPGAWILLGLAVADGGFLLVHGCYASVKCLRKISFDGFNIFLYTQRWLWMAGIYLIIALAVGRYIAVNKTHLARIWNSKGRQKIIVVVLFMITFFVTLPSFISKITIASRPQANVSQDFPWCSCGQSQNATLGVTVLPNQDPGTNFKATTPLGHSFLWSSTKSLASQLDYSTAKSSGSLISVPVWYHIVDSAISFVFLYLIPLPCLFMINI